MTTRTLLALALLLSACGDDTNGTRDAARPIDATQPIDAYARDSPALYAWEEEGCEEVPTCISYPGPAPVCPSVRDYVAEEPGERHNADCRRWLRCPRPPGFDGICLLCREWSSHPGYIAPPDPEVSTQPECTEELCPVPDGGAVRVCGDAGR